MSIHIHQILPENKMVIASEMDCFNYTDFPIDFFDERTVSLLQNISQQILKQPETRSQPAFVALAFWLRKSNIETLRKDSNEKIDKNITIIRQPLGIVFHVCPSNVDTIFLYSLALSLLAGNKNILRISHRMESAPLDALFIIIQQLLQTEEFKIFKPYFQLIKYGHEKEINEFFCAKADARIMWGGDKTVNTFRQFATSPRCKDIAFSDRISYSIIKSEAFLKLDENKKNEICKLLYNDAFVFDQLGCSSPQVLFFLGNESQNKNVKENIYQALIKNANEKYHVDEYSLASLKLNKLMDDAIAGKIGHSIHENNRVIFSELNTNQNVDDLHGCGGGYFYTISFENIPEIMPFISKRTQTIGQFGLTENDMFELAKLSRGKGLDRIVPMGQALSFSNYWDGFNLLDELCSLLTIG